MNVMYFSLMIFNIILVILAYMFYRINGKEREEHLERNLDDLYEKIYNRLYSVQSIVEKFRGSVKEVTPKKVVVPKTIAPKKIAPKKAKKTVKTIKAPSKARK